MLKVDTSKVFKVNVVLIVALVLFFSVFIVPNVVTYAATEYPAAATHGDYTYYIVTEDNYNKGYLYVCKNPIIGTKNSGVSANTHYYQFRVEDFECYQYLDGEWVYQRSSTGINYIDSGNYDSSTNTPITSPSWNKIVRSNHDVMVNGTIFFQRLPLAADTLGKMLSKAQPMGVMETIRGLVPLVIGLVVALIAFRKCWVWLKTQLSTL